MRTDEYDVFSGSPHAKPLRLGTVRGKERAIDLMHRMYARMPGDYFIREVATNVIIASVEEPDRRDAI